MTEIRIAEQAEQPTAVIREAVPMAALTGFFGRAFATVAEAVVAQGAGIAGPPFAKYYGMPTDVVDVEAGFPVARPVAPTGAVHAGALPAGRIYEAIHVGPYDTMESTYHEIMARITADGAAPGDVMWEFYLTDPEAEPDPAKWQTRICWPVQG